MKLGCLSFNYWCDLDEKSVILFVNLRNLLSKVAVFSYLKIVLYWYKFQVITSDFSVSLSSVSSNFLSYFCTRKMDSRLYQLLVWTLFLYVEPFWVSFHTSYFFLPLLGGWFMSMGVGMCCYGGGKGWGNQVVVFDMSISIWDCVSSSRGTKDERNAFWWP